MLCSLAPAQGMGCSYLEIESTVHDCGDPLSAAGAGVDPGELIQCTAQLSQTQGVQSDPLKHCPEIQKNFLFNSNPHAVVTLLDGFRWTALGALLSFHSLKHRGIRSWQVIRYCSSARMSSLLQPE